MQLFRIISHMCFIIITSPAFIFFTLNLISFLLLSHYLDGCKFSLFLLIYTLCVQIYIYHVSERTPLFPHTCTILNKRARQKNMKQEFFLTRIAYDDCTIQRKKHSVRISFLIMKCFILRVYVSFCA